MLRNILSNYKRHKEFIKKETLEDNLKECVKGMKEEHEAGQVINVELVMKIQKCSKFVKALQTTTDEIFK